MILNLFQLRPLEIEIELPRDIEVAQVVPHQLTLPAWVQVRIRGALRCDVAAPLIELVDRLRQMVERLNVHRSWGR